MSSKKGKKTKGITVPLQDFLENTPSVSIPAKINWADDQEDDCIPKEPVVLPTAPRAARDATVNDESIPTNPPYVAYISNLPYDVDEEDLHEFFAEMTVSGLRLPRDGNKFKGYGYIEFADRQSLKDALSIVDTNLKGRRIRIEVSNNDDRRGGRMGRMGDQRREYSPERTSGNWRTDRVNDGPRDDDRDGDRGGYRSRNYERRDDKDSGFEDTKSNWREGPRDFPERSKPSFRDARDSRPGPDDDRDRGMGSRFSDRTGSRGMRDGRDNRDGRDFRDARDGRDGRDGRDFRDGRDGSRERDGERSGGYGMRRHFNDDTDREREKDRWSSVRNQASQPREPLGNDEGPPAPATRPKLELKPRSKPLETVTISHQSDEKNSSDAPPPKSSANIFGAARPVDTAAKEREIEERLAKLAETEVKEKRPPRDGAWGRRNGEGGRLEQDRPSRPTWRSRPDGNDQRDHRDYRDLRDAQKSRESSKPRSDSRGSSSSRGGPVLPRGPSKQFDNRSPPDGAEKDKKRVELTDEEIISRMPKVKEDVVPNIVASNKYSMLPDDIDPDNQD
ncbi:eukaryotic translation initiation factor 4B isoform X2 [Copidosoma floridanum]|uniref:eukaryotic translation initiation factor 4B isoform X2 n=1 Tax=Copidosoma floridanum TaxID=29053 RepID=UPI000C6F5FFD|nr:eukaryotic translation initiation factor 4B isoform X2 [Copidosoma floridanum]